MGLKLFKPAGNTPQYFVHLVPSKEVSGEADVVAVDEKGKAVTRLLHVSSSGIYRYPNVNPAVAKALDLPLLPRTGRIALCASTKHLVFGC